MLKFKEHVKETTLKEGIQYHLENDIAFSECIFRPHSEAFYLFFVEARKQYNEGAISPKNFFDKELLESDIGDRMQIDGEMIPLDIPLTEAEYDGKDVELNEPKRGGSKKFYVYTKNPKTGNVIKVEFGDTSGLTAKINDPEARKSFAARHQCDTKKDKTKPGYWACRLPYYAKQLGLTGGGNFFW